MKRWTLALRADASADIGVGHVTRVLAVADEARSIGGTSVLFCNSLPDALVKRSNDCGVRVLRPQEITNFVQAEGRFDALLLDGYHIPCEEVAHFSKFAGFSTFLDDIGTSCIGHVDMVINPSFGGDSVFYQPGVEVVPSLDYAIVRREVRLITRAPENEHDGVLVILGGSDVSGIKDRVISALLSASDEKIFVAPGILPAIGDLLSNERVTYLESFEEIHSAFAQVRVVVCAAGGTLVEALFLAIPCIGLVVAENQRGALEASNDSELVEVIDMRSGFSEERLIEAVKLMEIRSHIQMDGERHPGGGIDGRGARRIAETLMARAGEKI